MPFKSNSQRRKFAELLKERKISKATFDEWNGDTPKHIPERIGPKKPKIKSVNDIEDHYKKMFGVKNEKTPK